MNPSILSELKKNKTYLGNKKKEQVMWYSTLTIYNMPLSRIIYFILSTKISGFGR